MSDLEEDFWLPQNHEHVGFFGSVVGGASLLLAWLWDFYVEYLWNWDRHPWVASAAATFKLTAILIIAPFALLSLLDVGAYVIARTLGVVETTKAATYDSKDSPGTYSDSDGSEAETAHTATSPVRIDVVHGTPEVKQDLAIFAPEADTSPAPSSSSGGTSSTMSRLKPRFDVDNLTIPTPYARFTHFGRVDDGPEAEACFFNPSDERQLELSGALLSSPAPSRQASPGLERRQRIQPLTAERVQTYDAAPGADSDASLTADSESFTVLDHSDLNRDGPEESDSVLNATANLRRRGGGQRDDGVALS